MKSLDLYVSDDGRYEGSYNQVKEYEDKIKAELMSNKQSRYDELSELIRNYVRDYGELKVRCKNGEVKYTRDNKVVDNNGNEVDGNKIAYGNDKITYDNNSNGNVNSWLDWYFC